MANVRTTVAVNDVAWTFHRVKQRFFPTIETLDIGHLRNKCVGGGHGMCLSLSDHDRLRIFVQEFVVRGLIPWAERMLRTLNEQVVTRKGLHRSLFSATKKWFGGGGGGGGGGGSKASLGGQASSGGGGGGGGGADKSTATNVVYTAEAPEMQQRRLADLAFMFHMYETAYQTYTACRRDFNSDNAWLHFAGSLEMAGLSVYMQGSTSQRQYPHHYMESAITTYLNSVRNPVFATRSALLSTEALKSKSMYEEAAMQFIKMTSEDSDLRSALLLEQASHCFIKMKQPMVRKYAFHMILAGHRFSKAGQRRHALRAYQQALQVYKGKLWSLAEDHINFTIGRQSFNLMHLENAAAAFKHLLTADSKQSPPQQQAFLREYLFVYKQLSSSVTGNELPQLPLPLSDGNAIKVLTAKPLHQPSQEGLRVASSVTFDSLEADNAMWQKLEELAVVSVTGGTLPINFKPTIQCATQRTHNAANPLAVIAEPIAVQVSLTNPLKIPLALSDVCLLWRFVAPDGSQQAPAVVVSNETADIGGSKVDTPAVTTQSIGQVLIEGNSTYKLELSVVPHEIGELHVTGLAYNLSTNPQQHDTNKTEQNNEDGKPNICVRGKVNLEVQGPRLNSTKEEKSAKMYGPDCRLDLLVTPAMPLLEVSFQDFPSTLLCGEVRQVMVHFRNSGSCPLHKLRVASTHPQSFTFSSTPSASRSSGGGGRVYERGGGGVSSGVRQCDDGPPVHHVTVLPAGQVLPAASLTLPMWLCGPSHTGKHTINFLFYYEPLTTNNTKLRHRVLRHEATVQVQASLLLKAVGYRSMASPTVPANYLPAPHEAHSSSPADDDDAKLTLALHIQNLNTANDSNIKEFEVIQVSCASKEWKLNRLSSPQNSGTVCVGGGESLLLCLRATRCEHDHTNQSQHIFTNVPLSDTQQVDSSATPCSDFFIRSRLDFVAFDEVEVEAPKPALVMEERVVEDKSIPLRRALEAKLTLIVIWKAVMETDGGEYAVTGQHHVALNKIQETVVKPLVPKLPLEPKTLQIIPPPREEQGDVMSVEPAVSSQLLQYTLHYPHNVPHNFLKHRLCQTAVSLSLQNCSGCHLVVDLKTSQLQSGAATDKPAPMFCDNGCIWSGQNMSQMTIPPASLRAISLQVCFLKPGVYNLSSSLQVHAAAPNAASVLQKPPAPSLIVISNAVFTGGS